MPAVCMAPLDGRAAGLSVCMYDIRIRGAVSHLVFEGFHALAAGADARKHQFISALQIIR